MRRRFMHAGVAGGKITPQSRFFIAVSQNATSVLIHWYSQNAAAGFT